MIADSGVQSILEGILSSHFGDACRVVRVTRSAFSQQSSFALDEIQVEVRPGDNLRLILKRQGPSGLLPQTPESRIQYPYDPECELRSYEILLRPELGTPKLFGSEIDPHQGRYWLFLEKVEGLKLCDIGDVTAWLQTSRWLARFHQNQSETDSRSWHTFDKSHYQLWRDRAERALANLRQKPASTDAREFAEVLNRYEDVITFLVDLPRKVIHGEFYASNIIISCSGLHIHRICPVDWGTTAVGPVWIDLAALTTGQWGARQKGLILGAYLDEVSVRRTPEIRYALLCCELHLVLQWIAMWSGGPGIQAWIPQACRIFRKIRRI